MEPFGAGFDRLMNRIVRDVAKDERVRAGVSEWLDFKLWERELD